MELPKGQSIAAVCKTIGITDQTYYRWRKEYGRYGTPRLTALLRGEGWLVNHKRIERIWREVGLKVPQKQPRRGRLWLNDGSCIRLRPQHKDHVWAYDFVSARTHDGVPFKLLTIVDEFTRECLAIDVARKLCSDDVLERLAWLPAVSSRGSFARSGHDAFEEMLNLSLKAADQLHRGNHVSQADAGVGRAPPRTADEGHHCV